MSQRAGRVGPGVGGARHEARGHTLGRGETAGRGQRRPLPGRQPAASQAAPKATEEHVINAGPHRPIITGQ